MEKYEIDTCVYYKEKYEKNQSNLEVLKKYIKSVYIKNKQIIH